MYSASRRRGGAVLLVASLLLVIATFCEAPLLDHADDRSGLFWWFVVAFILSAVGYLVAALLLALGRAAIAARSAAARTGLIAFGVLWLVAQVLYLFGTYLTPSDGLLLTSTILSLLMLVGGLVAAIVIGVRALLGGVARWSLLVGVLVSGVTGAIAAGSDSAVLVTVLHAISAAVLALVGLAYLLGRARSDADVR